MAEQDQDRTMDPQALEQDVRRTQDQIGETVQQIEQKLTPRELTRSVIGDDGQDLVREVLDVVRRNPVPAAMVAVGAIWLFASFGRSLRRITDRVTGDRNREGLRPRSEEPAPIGPPPEVGRHYDRRMEEADGLEIEDPLARPAGFEPAA